MKSRILLGWALALFMLSACSTPTPPAPTSTPTLRIGTLAPYQSSTPTVTLTPFDPSTPTPLPTPTPTPRTHVVKAGDDMTGIAIRYRVKLADLKAANPTVNPNLMRIGTVLIIPGSAPEFNPTGQATATPTPAPILLARPRCTLDPQGGATCFVMVSDQQPTPLENVTVTMRLLDAAAQEVQRLAVTTPLDLLQPGSPQPVMAYFNAPLPAGYQVAVELASALPAAANSGRYLAARVDGQQVNILTDGLSAVVSGKVISSADKSASQTWVAAIAYDAQGNVVGLRRWESSAPLPAGGSLPFTLRVYSIAGSIAKVELSVEARP